MKSLLSGIFIVLSVLFCASYFNAETKVVAAETGKHLLVSDSLQAIEKNVTEEEKEALSSIVEDLEVEELTEEIELLSDLDFQILDELFPEYAKAVIK